MDLNTYRLIKACFLGMTIVFTNFQSVKSICNETSKNGFPEIDCIYRNLTEVPQDLNPSVEVLFISFNPIKELRSDSFSRYTKLQQITFVSDSTFRTYIQPDAFVGIPDLMYLYLDGNDLSQTDLMFPPKILTLSFIGSKLNIESLDFTDLENLEILKLENNSLEYLPLLHKFTPLRQLYVMGNPLKRFSARQLARYCKLKRFSINLSAQAFTDDVCECPRLALWSEKKVIDLVTEKPGFACPKTEEKCKETLVTKRMNQLYDNCVAKKRIELEDDYDARAPPRKKWKKRLLIALIIAGVLILGAVIIYVLCFRKRVKIYKPLPHKERSKAVRIALPWNSRKIMRKKEH